MVFYRKYRPQTIDELDLESVRTRLTSILSAKELPHAFLFTGPKGLGKTSSARILAKAINCEVNQESRIKNQGEEGKKAHASNGVEPCNKCEACISITNGSNIDVLEIDAASNRGIDEIRDLREKIKFAPASLSRKVYIIDEVHMLTADAFNALLKTLEEPPSHAIFILCTTEVEKIPATIASRAFRVTFEKPKEEELTRSLKRVVKGEKLDVDDSVLEKIYQHSEGSFRDATKILEELAISAKGKIDSKVFDTTFSSFGQDTEIENLVNLLIARDLNSTLELINKLSQQNRDFKVVIEKLSSNIHRLLLEKVKLKDPDVHGLKRLLTLLDESYQNLKFSVLPQLPLELVAIEWCLDKKTDDGPTRNASQSDAGGRPRGAGQAEEKTEMKDGGLKMKDEEKEDVEVISPKPNTQDPTSASSHGALFNANSKPDNFLTALITRVKTDNHSIAGILRGCNLVEIGDGKVVFETKFKFHKDKLSEAKTANILNVRATELLKENVTVIVNLA